MTGRLVIAAPEPTVRSAHDLGAGPAKRRIVTGPVGQATLFLVLSLLTHLPGFTRRLWNQDEAFLGTQARVLADGGQLYVDVVDRKPPILPYLYMLAVELGDDDAILLMRGLGVVAHAVTAVLLAAIARRLWGRRAGFAAGVLYLLASVGLGPEDTQLATFEIFMLPPLVGSIYLALRGRFGAAGLAIAAATLVKQVAGATMLPLLVIAWRTGRSGRTGALRASGTLVLAYVVPIMACAFVFGWDRFWFWVVTGSGEYLDATGAIPYALSRGAGNLALLAVADLALVALAVSAIRSRSVALEWWLWLLSAVGAVCVGLRFFGHYYLQIVPALVLIAVGALRVYGKRSWQAVIAFSAISALVFTSLGFAWPDTSGRNAHSASVASAIRALSEPDDRIIVWGMYPEVYWLADRLPATRFITAGFLTNAGGGRPDWRVGQDYAVDAGWDDFFADVAAHPPELIVDDSDAAAYSVAETPNIQRLIATAGYIEVARVDGAIIYRRPG